MDIGSLETDLLNITCNKMMQTSAGKVCIILNLGVAIVAAGIRPNSNWKSATHSSELDLSIGIHLFNIKHLYDGLQLKVSSQMRCLKRHVPLASAGFNELSCSYKRIHQHGVNSN